MRKKILVTILAVVMVGTMAACGSGAEETVINDGVEAEAADKSKDISETDVVDENKTDISEMEAAEERNVDVSETEAVDNEEVIIEEAVEEVKETEEVSEAASDTEGISPEFKEMMDSYEAFFDEYVEFMKKYMNADATSIVSMMQDYTDYMTKYAEMTEKLSALENEEMSTEEALYYAEVSSRITQKLLEVQ